MVYGDIIIGSLDSSGGGLLGCVLLHQKLYQTEHFVIECKRCPAQDVIFFAFKAYSRYISDNFRGKLHTKYTKMKPDVQNEIFLFSSIDKWVVRGPRQGLVVLWYNGTRALIKF